MGLTSAAENADVLEYAQTYPEVAAEIESISQNLEAYAHAHAIEPGAGVKQKIISRINGTAPVVDMRAENLAGPQMGRVSPFWKYAAAACIILLVGSLVLTFTFYNRYQDASTSLASTRSELEKQKQLASEMHNEMGVITNMNAMPVNLQSMPDADNAAARIYWMKNTGEVYVDPSYLPQPPPGKQYQFWGIVDGKPVSGGMIQTDAGLKTVRIQKMKSFGNAQAFAISLEDAGPEKPVPTKVMAMGKIL